MDFFISGIGLVTEKKFGCAGNFSKTESDKFRLSEIARKDVLKKPYKPFGRMDLFSKIGFAGIYFSYEDAGLVNKNKMSNTSIIASTRYGCIAADYDFFDTVRVDNGKNASPALFAYTLPNIFLGEASIFLKLTGETFILNDTNANGITALKTGLDILKNKESDFVLCGLCDTNSPGFLQNRSSDFIGSLFFTIGLKRQKRCYGTIQQNRHGDILFTNKSVTNLFDLARACMKNIKF